MILINERFISADHIEHIYIEEYGPSEQYVVIVQLSGSPAVFGRRGDGMTLQMAFELRRRIVKAIVKYKSGEKPEVQHVELPTYQEVHPEDETETS